MDRLGPTRRVPEGHFRFLAQEPACTGRLGSRLDASLKSRSPSKIWLISTGNPSLPVVLALVSLEGSKGPQCIEPRCIHLRSHVGGSDRG